MPAVTSLDHLVLTVADIDTMNAFYSDLLGTIEKQFQPKAGGDPLGPEVWRSKDQPSRGRVPFLCHMQGPRFWEALICIF
ncbi:hypothetical protein [Yoonia sp.]|uniref:hypothetical protein n=1 Tax=Yoonia sp. TaxID=2212373 RepID=UPI0028A16CE4|nr:hypothetical protein [Yoonia sp.]